MKFGTVPAIAEQARPWATTRVIGPPPGEARRIGSLVAQVDDHTEFGRIFRVFLELDDGDLERIAAGNPIEIGLVTRVMVPVSVQVWETPEPATE